MTYCLILELLRTQNSNSDKEKTTAHRGIFIKKQQTAGILTKGFQLFAFIRAVFFQNNGTSCFPCQNTYPFFQKIPLYLPFSQHIFPFHTLIYTAYKCIYSIFMHNSAILYAAYRCTPFLSCTFHKTISFQTHCIPCTYWDITQNLPPIFVLYHQFPELV